MVYASVDDVKGRWISSSLLPDEDVIRAYLEDASTLIDSDPLISPPVAARVSSEPGLASKAKLVCIRMVLRCLTNPDQVRSGSHGTGPFSDTITYATETLSGSVGLTDEDRALLNGGGRRIGSVLPRTDEPGSGLNGFLYPSQIINWPASDREE